MYLVQLLPPALGEICEELSPCALLPCVPGEVSQGKGVRASSFTGFSASPCSPTSVCSRFSCSQQSRPLNEAQFYPTKLKFVSPGLYLSSFWVLNSNIWARLYVFTLHSWSITLPVGVSLCSIALSLPLRDMRAIATFWGLGFTRRRFYVAFTSLVKR